ncbi:MAG: hypothetical protein C5B51_07705 [Terriglobia bacterium]|nr:MAG: hypothetical protein C5B51_07705 [Terriglobia bacterium]
MKAQFLFVMGVLALLLAAAPVWAHHSFAAEYDGKQMVTLKGVVTKVEWTNPHIYIYIDVKDANGSATNWALEGYPPNTLKRTGFTRDLLKIGEEITVTAYKSKDGSSTGAGREVTFPDGSKKFAGPIGQ